MSKQNSPNTVKKIAAGAALVALSGFVPTPLVSPAMADTATITAAGTFGGGISMTAATNVKFNTIIANGDTGKLMLTASGTVTESNGFFNGATTPGKISFKAAAGSLSVSISVAGLTSGLALSDKGEGTQGSITVGTITMKGPWATTNATATLKIGTPAKVHPLKATAGTVPEDILVGTRVTWSGGRPIGGFSVPLTITVAY